jgi:hypothetical protein
MAQTAIHSLDSGRWMYPRASDLTSPLVQRYSDRELFWIVKNGIRLSGMNERGSSERASASCRLDKEARRLES